MITALSFCQAIEVASSSDEIAEIRDYYKEHHTDSYYFDENDEAFFFNDHSLVWVERKGENDATINVVEPEQVDEYLATKTKMKIIELAETITTESNPK